MRSFDEKNYVWDTSYKQLSRNGVSCHTTFNKMSLHPIPDELKDLKN